MVTKHRWGKQSLRICIQYVSPFPFAVHLMASLRSSSLSLVFFTCYCILTSTDSIFCQGNKIFLGFMTDYVYWIFVGFVINYVDSNLLPWSDLQALKNEIKLRESKWNKVYWEMIFPVVKIRTLRARLASTIIITFLFVLFMLVRFLTRLFLWYIQLQPVQIPVPLQLL